MRVAESIGTRLKSACGRFLDTYLVILQKLTKQIFLYDCQHLWVQSLSFLTAFS